MLEQPPEKVRLIICHLGHGCSATAVEHGRSVDTTMGFTPLEGLMMGTRSGSIDPGALLHVEQHHGLTAAQLDRVLNHDSGLLGVSGVSADMRQVMDAAESGNALAQLAIAIYARRVRQAIGALAVTMGGVEAVVFTAGVGEHAWQVRQAICHGLDCLGLRLDSEQNAHCSPDADVSRADSRGRILVIATQEHLTMLEEVMLRARHRSSRGNCSGTDGAMPMTLDSTLLTASAAGLWLAGWRRSHDRHDMDYPAQSSNSRPCRMEPSRTRIPLRRIHQRGVTPCRGCPAPLPGRS